MSLKQGAHGTARAAATVAVTLPSAVAAGDFIALITGTNSADTGNTVTDSLGNAYTLLTVTGSTLQAQFWYVLSSLGGSTNTVTFHVGPAAVTDYCGMAVGVWPGATGLDTPSPTWATGASSTAPAGTALTPTAGSLVIGAQWNDDYSSGDVQSAGTGWSDGPAHELTTATGDQPVGMEFIENATATAKTATWSFPFAQAYKIIEVAFTVPAAATQLPYVRPLQYLRI